jgi:hypothetical protein
LRCKFIITGEAVGGDQADIKMWLEESIKEYNKMPTVVQKFQVDVWEMDLA